MQSTAIDVHDLHKSYGCQLVLRGLWFAVAAGEIFGIAGRNGAGKTTAVAILQGLRSRDAGDVEVPGLDPGSECKRLRPPLGSQLETSSLPHRFDPAARRETWLLIERARDQRTTVVALSERRCRTVGRW